MAAKSELKDCYMSGTAAASSARVTAAQDGERTFPLSCCSDRYQSPKALQITRAHSIGVAAAVSTSRS